jgi:hypothetical protein
MSRELFPDNDNRKFSISEDEKVFLGMLGEIPQAEARLANVK